MDRGDSSTDRPGGTEGIEGVAADASARVGEILAEAERRGHAIQDEAERDAAGTLEAAEQKAGRIAEEAREAAREAARERVQRLAELQTALTARGPAVLEGLEGSGLTRARLEALIEALAATSDRVLEAAEEGDPRGGAFEGDAEAASEGGSEAEDEAVSPDEAEAEQQAEDDDDPVTAAEELAQPVKAPDAPEMSAATDTKASPLVEGNGDGNADGNGSDFYDGPLPEGAPLARKPMRSRDRDARFAALLLAVQGRDRGDVEAHLRSEYGFADCEPILDEVFGPAHA